MFTQSQLETLVGWFDFRWNDTPIGRFVERVETRFDKKGLQLRIPPNPMRATGRETSKSQGHGNIPDAR